jgi:predicted O-linked N-acetylglucosamine transferase (SPINDLY family)
MPLPPRSPLSKLGLIESLIDQGKHDQARVMALRLAQSTPNDPAVNQLLAGLLRDTGEHRQAVFYADRAVAAAPDEPRIHALRATILLGLQQFDEAIKSARRAVELAPGDAKHRAALVNMLFARARVCEVVDALSVNGEVSVADPSLAITAGYALAQLGRHHESQALFARAMAAHPDNTTLASARCNAGLYVPGTSREEVFEAHRRYGQMIADLHRPGRPAVLRNPDPARRLRVGILSPDLRRHSVAFFITPFFERYDPAQIELVVFDTSAPGQADDITERLRSRASVWRRITPRSLIEFADVIRRDQIDVLIELSGHTGAHALEIMPYGPAPVLVSYLGYPCTTGLTCMDYRIVDSITDPAPDADRLSTERLIRLDPCFLCYSPPAAAPRVATPDPARPITFGSFNNASKLNEPLVALWSRILAAAPSSGIMLKAISLVDQQARDRLTTLFAKYNIPADRVRFGVHSPTVEDHLARYADIDIALDTFPYHGTTTTCDALLMGVPVVTLMGDRHLSRVGGSLLHAAGLPELIAHNEDEYVAIATGLAADRPRLAGLRSTLRPRLLASPLCDGVEFVRRFEGAIRRVWQDRCRAAEATTPAQPTG